MSDSEKKLEEIKEEAASTKEQLELEKVRLQQARLELERDKLDSIKMILRPLSYGVLAFLVLAGLSLFINVAGMFMTIFLLIVVGIPSFFLYIALKES